MYDRRSAEQSGQPWRLREIQQPYPIPDHKGRFDSCSLTEGWCEGSKVRFLVICGWQMANLTLVRHMVRAARPLATKVEAFARALLTGGYNADH